MPRCFCFLPIPQAAKHLVFPDLPPCGSTQTAPTGADFPGSFPGHRWAAAGTPKPISIGSEEKRDSLALLLPAAPRKWRGKGQSLLQVLQINHRGLEPHGPESSTSCSADIWEVHEAPGRWAPLFWWGGGLVGLL